MPRGRTKTENAPVARRRPGEPAFGASGGLPLQLSSFIGRERELAEVKGLLAETRLLTLTGPGGCGKTRLALRTASDVSGRFEGGAWTVELAPISDPTLVPQTVAAILGVREQPGRTLMESISDRVGTEEVLLVLDNCEHLIDACAVGRGSAACLPEPSGNCHEPRSPPHRGGEGLAGAPTLPARPRSTSSPAGTGLLRVRPAIRGEG
jgi:hypothetical protein